MFELKQGDEVYVLKNSFFRKKNFKIEEDMFGTIINIEKWNDLGCWGDSSYDCFKVKILLNNGEIINITDEYTKMLFRKYEFIKADDLNRVLEVNPKQPKKLLREINNLIIKEYSN